jgi:transcriptional regulator with XRE-family HTH domain
MKAKFFIFLILLILICGTVFYFGWIQFKLDENTYGVIFTKTNGYDDDVVIPGKFIWRWEALIPTNLTLHTFEITPQTKQLSKIGSLPSGDIYGSVLEEKTDFSFKLNMQIDYRIKPELLPVLVEEEGLTQEDLAGYYSRIEQELSNSVSVAVAAKISAFDSSDYGQFMLEPFRKELTEVLQEQNEAISITNVSILELVLPDIQLYRSARSYYLSLIETRRQTETAVLENERTWVVSEESKLEVLKKYGELFTEYPGLIQFLALRDRGELQDMLPEIELLRQNPPAGTVPNE